MIIKLNNCSQGLNASITEKVLLIIKLARPRTWMFAIMSYLFAYLEGRSLVMWQIALGVAIFSLLTGATNMINAYTDMSEDAVNNPFRTTWIRRLGVRNLVLSIVITYSLAMMLSLPFGLPFTSVIMISIFDSIFYSLPPIRFKNHPVTALLAFSGAVGLPFLAGLTVINKLSLINPYFIIFTLFMLTYGSVKNIPDFLGDQSAGLRTTATIFKDFRKAVKASAIILLSPYLLLLLFIGIGIMDRLYLLNVPFMAFPLYWAYRNLKTDGREVMEKLHTYGFIYAVSFFLFNLLLTYPSFISITITMFVLSIILLMTKLNIDSRDIVNLK